LASRCSPQRKEIASNHWVCQRTLFYAHEGPVAWMKTQLRKSHLEPRYSIIDRQAGKLSLRNQPARADTPMDCRLFAPPVQVSVTKPSHASLSPYAVPIAIHDSVHFTGYFLTSFRKHSRSVGPLYLLWRCVLRATYM
jgi:hypothetical protein